MLTDPTRLIHGYLDGSLSSTEQAEFASWIASNETNARQFAAMALLDDRLRDNLRRRPVPVEALTVRPRIDRLSAMRRWIVVGGLAAALILALLLLPPASNRQSLAAETELIRLIEVSSRATDRTYQIRSLNPRQPPGPPPGQVQGDTRPPIDGALLYARGAERHVLKRYFPGGDLFITGSNDRESWAIPPEGPVRISEDPTRYRGAAPGEQQNVPFLIPDALSRLRETYDLQIDQALTSRGGLSRLVARKRSSETRGPVRVQLWFRPGSDVIERLQFEGIPSPRGGEPLSLELRLVGQDDLGPTFFEHAAHHQPGRPVLREP